jgi:hypothetical protein
MYTVYELNSHQGIQPTFRLNLRHNPMTTEHYREHGITALTQHALLSN